MENGVKEKEVVNENLTTETPTVKEEKIINLSSDSKDGQNKCPKCGATEIELNPNTGNLKCGYCRHEFKDQVITDEEIFDLEGITLGLGADQIDKDTSDLLTLKCDSCGAEVIIDTKNSLNSRCHWCRNVLSINKQIPNGAVPDMVLPFKIIKNDARKSIEEFVHKRQFFANPKFKQEFTTENIMGVYLPYMVVDVNAHATLTGEAEIEVRSYTVKVGDSTERRYDADVYNVKRDFDIAINNVTVESNLEKLKHNSKDKTNNIINAIMPFDIENCVKWDANYITGFTSEKRDIDVKELQTLLKVQATDVTRHKINETLLQYDRGVRWENEVVDIKGQKWLAAYLPVWLYSYQQVSGSKKVIHYVAVNARTKETMGSVPIDTPKLLLMSFIVEIFGLLAMIFIDFDYSFIFLAVGFIYYFYYHEKYRNKDARHYHELETDCKIKNIIQDDTYVKRRKGLDRSSIVGVNNRSVKAKGLSIDKMLGKNIK